MYDDARYRAARKSILATEQPCHKCGRRATTIDHVPPLSSVADPRTWQGELLPACKKCNYGHGLNRKTLKGGRVTYRR